MGEIQPGMQVTLGQGERLAMATEEYMLPRHADSPYFAEYLGIWAIVESALQAHVEFVRNVDLTLHLSGPQAADARKAGQIIKPVVSDQVALISITGTMMKQATSMGGGTSTVRVREAIRSAARNPEIGAIVLRIDSPGGTVSGTEELAADVASANSKKPVFAFVEDLGASAAYWIASQAREVNANATALVGSIGTYGVVQDLSAMAAKEGVKVHVIRAGAYKGAGVPGTEITTDQLNEMQRTVNALNSHFLDAVAAGRSMLADRVASLADGRVHIASEAKRLGLIDRISTLDETIHRAQLAARQDAKRKPVSAVVGSSISSIPKGQKMSDSQELVVAEPLQPQAATVAQIKAAFPTASADFIVGQLGAGATMADVQTAWVAKLTADNATLQAEVNASRVYAEKLKSVGVPALAVAAVDADSNAVAKWRAAVDANLARGMKSEQAVLQADRNNPGLREAMVAEVNVSRRRGA